MTAKVQTSALLAMLAMATLATDVTLRSAHATASPGETTLMSEVRDRAAIDALMWQYVRALDSLDENAYASLYTANGSFGSGARAAQGRDALKKMIRDLKQTQAERAAKSGGPTPSMYHVITNSYLELLDHDHARLYAYWMTVFAATDPQSQPRIAAVGRSIDELVRLGGHWLIQKRDVAPP